MFSLQDVCDKAIGDKVLFRRVGRLCFTTMEGRAGRYKLLLVILSEKKET